MAEIWVPSAGIPGQERIRCYCSNCGNAVGFRSGPTGTVEQDRPPSECDDCKDDPEFRSEKAAKA